MRKLKQWTVLGAALCLAGCAGFGGQPLVPGEPRAAVEAKRGPPTGIYAAGEDTLLEYATGPFGQYTYMARIGPDGRLTSYEQVLTAEKFGDIKVGRSTKQDVLRIIGRPTETSYLSWQNLEVWSYRYKESGVWDSMMHVHFDRNGVVHSLLNGPDPLKEERRGFFR